MAKTEEEKLRCEEMQASQKQALLNKMEAFFDAKNYTDAATATMQLKYL
jgi:hypothetical protein